MGLLDQIDADIKTALKAGDAAARATLSMVKSALNNYRIAQRKDTLTDEDVISVLQKEVKSRTDAAEEYRQHGAEDRAKQEEAEAQHLQKYLPAQMSQEEIKAAVAEAVKKTGAASQKVMGKVMGMLSKELKGKADLKLVNQLVREQLTGG